jgi:1,2-diacylglycerol 3-alpha-glucosyltransferase
VAEKVDVAPRPVTKKDNVFLVCTSLGRVQRGYESFTDECFRALGDTEEFNLLLFGAKGLHYRNSYNLWNIWRDSWLAFFLNRVFGLNRYIIEQISYCFVLTFYIWRFRPKVIYYSDFPLGNYLFHYRRLFKLEYRLLFSNGAPIGPPYLRQDHVQHVLDCYREKTLREGEDPARSTALHYGFEIPKEQRMQSLSRKQEMRQVLGLPADKKIILSVGNVAVTHKRMDHLIRETALLPDEYFLVILGKQDVEAAQVRKLAEEQIKDRFLITTVAHSGIEKYYIASDFFALASLHEGFGRVYVEALSYGLPCFAHDNEITREIFGAMGQYVDMTDNGALAAAVRSFSDTTDPAERIGYAYDNFSWEVLKKDYIELIKKQL